ncbi:MAG: hypothetical protein GY856_52710, partial [bacterium]|nr:hypothetical protein [bacterium]
MARKATSRQRLLAFCVSLVFVGIALTGNVCAASCLSPEDRALPLGEERPGKHPEFSEGFRAYQRENWLEAAEWMCTAEERWPEDGELTRTHGRRFLPYLPRYYLGVALYEIGCYQAALNQFNASILHQREVRNTGSERKTLLLH